MSKEKQIEGMAKDLGECHTIDEWAAREYGEAYTDFHATAEKMLDRGWSKQSVGEWIAKDDFNGRCSIATCSNCGTEKAFSILVRTETIAELYPYCQKCGAKMKGGEE